MWLSWLKPGVVYLLFSLNWNSSRMWQPPHSPLH